MGPVIVYGAWGATFGALIVYGFSCDVRRFLKERRRTREFRRELAGWERDIAAATERLAGFTGDGVAARALDEMQARRDARTLSAIADLERLANLVAPLPLVSDPHVDLGEWLA
jgi:hypothetical protein